MTHEINARDDSGAPTVNADVATSGNNEAGGLPHLVTCPPSIQLPPPVVTGFEVEAEVDAGEPPHLVTCPPSIQLPPPVVIGFEVEVEVDAGEPPRLTICPPSIQLPPQVEIGFEVEVEVDAGEPPRLTICPPSIQLPPQVEIGFEVEVDVGDADRFMGTAGNNVLTGSAEADVLFGDRGADTLAGGGGADTFVFKVGDGRDRISDFEDGSDVIEIAASMEFDDLTITSSGGDAVIGYGHSGDTITLTGVTVADLTADDFQFA